MNALLEAALGYAAKGWPVFPCRASDSAERDNGGVPLYAAKAPLVKGGLKAASCDAGQIRTWWARWPDALIGLPLGGATGVFALDFDPREDVDTETGELTEFTLAQLKADTEALIGCELPSTVGQRTPSGGVHIFFRQPAEGPPIRNRGCLPLHVDVRGEGGYVIVPPSVVLASHKGKTGPYRWLRADLNHVPADAPQALIDVLRAPKGSRVVDGKVVPPERGRATAGKSPVVGESADDAVRKYALAALEAEIRALAATPQGNRNNQINASAFALGQLVGAGALSASVARASLQHVVAAWPDAAKSEKTIESGLAAGIAQPRDLSEVQEAAARRAERKGSGARLRDDPGPEDPGGDVPWGAGFAAAAPQEMSDFPGDWPLRDEPAGAEDVAAIAATPFDSWPDEIDLPRRQWLYGFHLLRGRVSLDVAAGGIGKSALKIGEALAMATGRQLYGHEVGRPDLPGTNPLRVWLYNLEDDAAELLLRTRAAMKHFDIGLSELGGRLFVDSGLDQPCVVAREGASGTIIAEPVVDAMIAEIRRRRIDVLILDPFVSSHTVSENDNAAIDAVVKRAWVRIAHACNCSVNLVHHIRKGNGEAATADSARGASALIGAARSVQVYNRMTEEEAERAKVKPEHRRFYFRVTNEKANMAPPPERADWYRMVSVDLANGEKVGVASPWLWPIQPGATPAKIAAVCDALSEGDWRLSVKASEWAGYAIAPIFEIDPTGAGRRDLQRILGDLISAGHLKVVSRLDKARRPKECVVPARGGDDE